MITKTIPISMGKGAHSFEIIEESVETETTTWSEFYHGEKFIANQRLVSDARIKS